MPFPDHTVGLPAIIENLLKHQWSRTILQHLRRGTSNPTDIARIEIYIAPSSMAERLRAMVRYNLIRRANDKSRNRDVTYRLTAKGQRVLALLDVISQLDQLADHDPRTLGEVFDAAFQLRPAPPVVIDDGSPQPPKAIVLHTATRAINLVRP